MYPCEDPECECCNHDEFLKNWEQEHADNERRKAKKLARKAARKPNA